MTKAGGIGSWIAALLAPRRHGPGTLVAVFGLTLLLSLAGGSPLVIGAFAAGLVSVLYVLSLLLAAPFHGGRAHLPAFLLAYGAIPFFLVPLLSSGRMITQRIGGVTIFEDGVFAPLGLIRVLLPLLGYAVVLYQLPFLFHIMRKVWIRYAKL